MTGISTFASNRILDFLLGRETLVVPNIFHLALSTTPLGNDGLGATEPTDPSYSRIPIPNNKATFSVAANRIITLISEFIYPPSTMNWPRVAHFLLLDSAVGGNVWFYGELQNSIDVEIETSPWIPANTNEISLDICGGSSTDLAMPTLTANRILDFLFGLTPVLVPPANFYLGVSSTPIGTEGVGMTEPSGGGYQRLQLPNNKNIFTDAANKMVTLRDSHRFPESTTPWGNMTHFFITDAASGVGNVWWSGELVHSRNVEIATTLAVLPNGFRWYLDSCVPTVTGTSSFILPTLS